MNDEVLRRFFTSIITALAAVSVFGSLPKSSICEQLQIVIQFQAETFFKWKPFSAGTNFPIDFNKIP